MADQRASEPTCSLLDATVPGWLTGQSLREGTEEGEVVGCPPQEDERQPRSERVWGQATGLQLPLPLTCAATPGKQLPFSGHGTSICKTRGLLRGF